RGNPNHSATEYKDTKLIAKATSPATITPAMMRRMKPLESGFIRLDAVAAVCCLSGVLNSAETERLLFWSVIPSVSPATRIVGDTSCLLSLLPISGLFPFLWTVVERTTLSFLSFPTLWRRDIHGRT